MRISNKHPSPARRSPTLQGDPRFPVAIALIVDEFSRASRTPPTGYHAHLKGRIIDPQSIYGAFYDEGRARFFASLHERAPEGGLGRKFGTVQGEIYLDDKRVSIGMPYVVGHEIPAGERPAFVSWRNKAHGRRETMTLAKDVDALKRHLVGRGFEVTDVYFVAAGERHHPIADRFDPADSTARFVPDLPPSPFG